MALSPNYGWSEPDDTDLVKNGALAIRTLGNAIDTTMATMTPKSIVDAKGDLIAASAADTPARLAVGNNGETLVVDSSTSTGLRYQPTRAAGRNYFVNGGMDCWQRGTSVALGSGSPFLADRWQGNRQGNVGGVTMSRQSASLTGFQYSLRVQRDSGNTSTNYINFGQNIESINSIPLAGQTVTISFWAKAGANYSAASNFLNVGLVSGTGTDQNLVTLGGLTGGAYVVNPNATLTTSWQRFTFTGTVGSSATQVCLSFYFTPTGTAGANDWVEVTGIQLEVGSVATAFTRTGGSIQGELAMCQRYYFRTSPASAQRLFGTGFNQQTTAASAAVVFPVEMRTRPTALEQSGTASDYAIGHGNGTETALNAVPTYGGYTTNRVASISGTVASGLTAGQGNFFIANGANAYLGWSAEL